MSVNKQARDEIQIFKDFAHLCPYPIDLDSVQKRQPPEPDLVCNFLDGTRIAFELVQIIETRFAQRNNDLFRLKNDLDEQFRILRSQSPDKHNRITHKFGNAWILVSFRRDISVVKGRKAIRDFFEFLAALEDAAEGKYNLSSDPKLGKIICWVYIGREENSPVPRPSFEVQPSGSLADPVCQRIEEKFNKTYHASSTIELLAYYELQPPPSDKTGLSLVENFIKTNIQRSPFVRVWIYSARNKKILYTYPLL